MRPHILILLALAILPSCIVHESRELHRDYVMDYQTLSTPSEPREMRVFAIANASIDLLSEDEFFSALSSFFAPIVAIPTGLVDLVCFPFKWVYCHMTLLQEDEVPAETSPESSPSGEGNSSAPVPESPAGPAEPNSSSR
ncbi:MAG: hypothetical protein AB7F75_00975 [Planctomycetota bacterium]